MTPSLDPHFRPIYERMRTAPAIDYRAMPIGEARKTFEALAQPWNEGAPALAAVREFTVRTAAGQMRARLYEPAADALANGLVVYVHGGGWTFGSVDTHDGTMRNLAQASGCAVLGMDYRLAPEHPFPAPLDDVLAALAFAADGGLGRPVDMGRIALAGDSAGANLALAALLARRDRRQTLPPTAALFYGCYAPIFDTASHERLGDGSFFFSTAIMQWYWGNFLGPLPADTAALAAPLRASLQGLPPLYLNAAGLDPLLDDTLLLAEKLAHAGIPFRLDVFPGVVHGFLRMTRELPAAQAAIAAAATHIREVFGR
ncbi:alpha/beta hydrolase [Chelatococcus composti]|jgi:Esterase/lipase|uniref:Acetyl esterase n=1 Tax=Chelatococcus composti TaxID=1743235 RepID=A0A841KHY8_9HYPH|nr:alpha/beta hydrolase [Chelatococcus composti]MBB6169546.1 acetyl esterase [Chelatococcus composti]MBS7736131.1 alpha/beta hydrolase [Chelatococcus composti]GGG48563.1 acetylesterase [Chelatococcus composti]